MPVIICATCGFGHAVVNRRADGKIWCVRCQEWRDQVITPPKPPSDDPRRG